MSFVAAYDPTPSRRPRADFRILTVTPPVAPPGVAAALTRARLDWIWARAERAWYFANAANRASLALHAAFGFVEVGRGPEFQAVRFEGGTGVLPCAVRPLPGS
ncbi:hypothetical protein ABZV93_10395 [Actinopolymorpha sp. NPDC004070]|uniref:hypothetical protein n=1 Tax=Actinopolymorpha sp. NPDC004070 TaxID=3154548 RepID=UPI0033BAF6E0